MLKKLTLLGTALFFIFNTSKAQTPVSGTLSSNTTWTKINSPYQLTSNLTLNVGDTLTIEPGVEVQFNHYSYVLTINGTLISEGLFNDSIVFNGAAGGPGRVRLTSSGLGSKIDYTRFQNLGVFNNPALEISAQQVTVNRSSFSSCELGILVESGADPIIDSSLVENSADHGILVRNGLPIIKNSTIDGSAVMGILLEDTAHIINNTISNNGGTYHARAGIHIDGNFYPYITGNTFTNNSYDIYTHPALLNDTLYDNNGLSEIHIQGKIIGETTTWHKPVLPEDWRYVITGPVTVNNGDSLILEPGIEVKFRHYADNLYIQGTLISQGTPQDSITFTGNPLGGLISFTTLSTGSKIDYSHFDGLGSFNNPALGVSTSSISIDRSTFDNCEVSATFYNGASPVMDSCHILNSRDWGVRVENGHPTIKNCSIDGSVTAGVFLLDTALIYNNTITNNGSGANTAGIFIENVVHPYINNNVFNNPYADILTHPAVVNDTLFDNNGLSVIHINNKTIGQTTTWHEPVLPEDWYYVLTFGNITVNAGDTLTIEPGVEMQIEHHGNVLNVYGTLLAEGTRQDSIIFNATPLGGRINFNSTSANSILDFTQVNGLGSFNNSGIGIYTSDVAINRSTFVKNEVGIAVYSNAAPSIDSCEFRTSADWGIRVLSGAPIIRNSLFDGNRIGGLELLDTAIILNSTFSNHNYQNYTVGVHINAPVYPSFQNNVFTNNNQDVLAHPAVLNDTLFDNNGLSEIHIDNILIGQSTTWHAPVPPENWEYVTTGDVTVFMGDTLQLEAGATLRFTHYTHDLIVDGTLLSNGTKQDSVRFLSSSIGGRILLGGYGSNSKFNYSHFHKMGSFNLSAINVASFFTSFKHSTFTECEIGIRTTRDLTIDSCLFENCIDFGIKVAVGNTTVSNSCIVGNNFGIDALVNATVNAVDNWWGDTTGATHTSNPLGIGDEVSDRVTFSPWLKKSPCEFDPGPMAVSFSPADDAVNVPVGTNLKVQFNENIQKGNIGRVKVLRLVDSSVVYDEDITHAGITVGDDTLYFSAGTLPVNTPLFITIDSNAVQNLNNAAFSGIKTNSAWNFTTEDDFDNDGFTPSQGDCDDMDSDEFPGQTWYADTDNDTYGDPGNSLVQCLRPIGYVLDNTDCDDTDPDEFPGQTWYADTDNDGFGDPNNTLVQCLQPAGYLLDNTDCDDTDANEFPGQTWYADTDNDTYGDPNNTLVQCLQPAGYVLDDTDCDDTDPDEFPGQTWYADTDNDGFGDPNNTLVQCLQPAGYLLDNTDCDDTDPLLFPGQTWYADTDNDGFGDANNTLIQCLQPAGYLLDDTDCDDTDADEFPGQTWYADTDGDLFGDSLNFLIQCEQPPDYVLDSTDCDDEDSTAYPGATELLDGKDNDCDGEIDEDIPDGIDLATNNDESKLWPNPTDGLLYIELPSFNGKQAVLEVIGLDGKALLQQETNEQPISLDLGQLSSGLYLLKISVENEVYHKRFTKK